MPNELIEQITAARRSGSDLCPVIEAWLKTNHKSTGRSFTLLVTVAVVLAAILAVSVIGLALPALSDFSGVLQSVITVSLAAASLSMAQALRIHSTRNTNFGARLLMASGGSAQDALKLMFAGKGKGNALADIISAGGEAAN